MPSFRASTRAPGSASSAATVSGCSVPREEGEPVARERPVPRRPGGVLHLHDLLEAVRAEQLEADVEGDPAAQLGMPPEQPVGELLVGQHPPGWVQCGLPRDRIGLRHGGALCELASDSEAASTPVATAPQRERADEDPDTQAQPGRRRPLLEREGQSAIAANGSQTMLRTVSSPASTSTVRQILSNRRRRVSGAAARPPSRRTRSRAARRGSSCRPTPRRSARTSRSRRSPRSTRRAAARTARRTARAARARAARAGARARGAGSAARRHDAERRAQADEGAGEQHAAVQVRPQHEQRHEPEDAAVGRTRIAREQPHRDREERVGERLRADARRHDQRERGQCHDGRPDRRPAEPRAAAIAIATAPTRHTASSSTSSDAPAEREGAVRDEVREPLLVDPRVPGGERHQAVGVGQAVLRDVAPVDQVEPGVVGQPPGSDHQQQRSASSTSGSTRTGSGSARTSSPARPSSRWPRDGVPWFALTPRSSAALPGS